MFWKTNQDIVIIDAHFNRYEIRAIWNPHIQKQIKFYKNAVQKCCKYL